MPKRRANGEGTITQRKSADGKKTNLWQAQFIDFSGKRRTLYGKTQQEALKKMKEAQGKSDMGVSVDGDKVTFSEWMEQWLEVYAKPTIKESTYAHYHNSIHNHIIPAFPNVLLKDLRTDILQRFFNKKAVSGRNDKRKDPETGALVLRSGGLSVSMLSKMKMLMLLALSAAMDNNLIIKNVAEKVKLPKDKPGEIEILTIDEQKKLEEVIHSDNLPLSFCVLFDLYTGLRIGELSSLKISDIDFGKKELHVRRSKKRVPVIGEETKTRIIISEPKTEKSKRTIPLPEFLIDMLKKHIAERNEYICVLAECFHGGADKWVDEGHLFITQHGTAQENSNIAEHFKSLLKKAGIKHIKFHALRHTFASRCIEAGFDIKSLADILGHTDVKMTLRIYAHSLQEQKRKNMDKLMPLFNHEPEAIEEQP